MFEIEKFSREIDSSKDVEELQLIAKKSSCGLEAATSCISLGHSSALRTLSAKKGKIQRVERNACRLFCLVLMN
jgi:hypothetical protein